MSLHQNISLKILFYPNNHFILTIKSKHYQNNKRKSNRFLLYNCVAQLARCRITEALTNNYDVVEEVKHDVDVKNDERAIMPFATEVAFRKAMYLRKNT